MRFATNYTIATLLAIVITTLVHSSSTSPNPHEKKRTDAEAQNTAKELSKRHIGGLNDWSCKPTAKHPRPLVLVHGLICKCCLVVGDDWAAGDVHDLIKLLFFFVWPCLEISKQRRYLVVHGASLCQRVGFVILYPSMLKVGIVATEVLTLWLCRGYCVFSLTYGQVSGLPLVAGLDKLENSAQELSVFVDKGIIDYQGIGAIFLWKHETH